jgi:hypothetical protein
MDWEEVLGFLFLVALAIGGIAFAYACAKFSTMAYRHKHSNTTSLVAKLYACLVCLLVAGGVALFLSHSPGDCEGCDEDEAASTMTPAQRNTLGAKVFFSILLPSLVGVYSGFKAKPEELRQNSDDPMKEWEREEEERKKAADKVDAFGRFLAEGQPPIWDARKLPYPKREIMVAYSVLEQYLYALITASVNSDLQKERSEYQEQLEWLRTGRVYLAHYADIQMEDAEAVDYFNSYKSINDVPEEERAECMKLMAKYLSIGAEGTNGGKHDSPPK